MATQRLPKDLQALKRDPLPAITAEPDGEDIRVWRATIEGPPKSPYAGRVFTLSIHFPDDYPFKPPTVTFVTPIKHIYLNNGGSVCMDTLKEGGWRPAMTASTVLASIYALMAKPQQ